MSINTYDLAHTFAVLTPSLRVQPVPVTPGLYEGLDTNFEGFKDHLLISVHKFSEDWPTWERHPAGDEFVMLLSGQGTLVLRTTSGDENVALMQPGSYVLVPRNTWHTAHVSEPTEMLFITPGENTENREQP